MKKILFLATTIFHKSASILLAKELKKTNKYKTYIVYTGNLFSISQKQNINNIFDSVFLYNDYKQKILNFIKINKELEFVLNDMRRLDVDFLVTFCDNNIITQSIMRFFSDKPEIYFEEGTGAYSLNKLSFRAHLVAFLRLISFSKFKYRVYPHSRSKLFEYAFVSRPELFNRQGIKKVFRIPSEFYKKLFFINTPIIDNSSHGSILIILSGIPWDTNNKLYSLLEKIINYIVCNFNLDIYIKPHPSASEELSIKLSSISNRVFLINDTKGISEEYCNLEMFNTIITDFSSTAFNCLKANINKNIMFLYPMIEKNNLFYFGENKLKEYLSKSNKVNLIKDLKDLNVLECIIDNNRNINIKNNNIHNIFDSYFKEIELLHKS